MPLCCKLLKSRIHHIIKSVRVGTIIQVSINANFETRCYFVLGKSDTLIELVPYNMDREYIIELIDVSMEWNEVFTYTFNMVIKPVYTFTIIEQPDIPKWSSRVEICVIFLGTWRSRKFLLVHRFHVYARTIQRAWRAHSKRRKQKAVALIENAVLHAMYKPGGWLAPTRFKAI